MLFSEPIHHLTRSDALFHTPLLRNHSCQHTNRPNYLQLKGEKKCSSSPFFTFNFIQRSLPTFPAKHCSSLCIPVSSSIEGGCHNNHPIESLIHSVNPCEACRKGQSRIHFHSLLAVVHLQQVACTHCPTPVLYYSTPPICPPPQHVADIAFVKVSTKLISDEHSPACSLLGVASFRGAHCPLLVETLLP